MRGTSLIAPARPTLIHAPPRRASRIGARPLTKPAPQLRNGAEQSATARLGFGLERGLYQNNGATPWYASLSLGTPGQPLKIALDTGSNFVWVTSSLCASTSCKHYGNSRFNYQDSATFDWINQTQQKVDFGPWGSMWVEVGSDDVQLPPGASVGCDFYLAADYSGEQFAQLDWDGGIGIPSGSDYASPEVSFFVAELMNSGLMDPANPYVSFASDPANRQGSVVFGGFDSKAFDPYSGIFLPWTPYTAFPGVKYIWTSPLNQYLVGPKVVATTVQFCLDSGSSQFKGDNNIMNTTLQLVGSGGPDVTLTLGQTFGGLVGEIVVPPSIYMVEIEAGPQKGQVLPQFNPLGLTDLVLVGSVLMDQLYTIYLYDVTQTQCGYHLAPIGMFIFNRIGGANLIRSRSTKPFQLGPRAFHRV